MPERRTVRLGWWLSSEEHDPRHLARQAQHAEAAGFTTAMISDHLRPWITRTGHAPHVWTTLGAIAHATDAIEVGTGVTAILHRMHPITVAHAAATAALLFEGRFFLGVGTGERLNEQPFGHRWPRPAERRACLREAVEVVRRLLAGETVDQRGTYFVIESLDLATRPAPPPPVYLAASGPSTAALAGEVGDGIIAVVPDAHLTDVFRASGGAGKPHLAQLHVCLGATLHEAAQRAREWWPVAAIAPALLPELPRPREFEAATRHVEPDDMRRAVVCATDASPIVAAIDTFVAAGFDTVYLHQIGPDPQPLLDLSESELLPHYAAAR
jgi:G6PDH family F420-dependent oxidoreductase